MSEGEQHWHFISVVDHEQYGPYTADQLQGFVAKGSITRETLVWTEALEDQWIPATNVEGLFPTEPHRPQLLTGAAAQSAHALGAASAAPLQAVPQAQVYQQPVVQAAPLQPQPQVQHQQVRPGMIPSSLPGTVPQATPVGAAPLAPVAGALQTAPVAGFGVATPGLPTQLVPPGQLYPPPGPVKASFAWIGSLAGLTLVLFIGCFFAALGRLKAAAGSVATIEDFVEVISESIMIILGGVGLALCYLWYHILGFIYLYRAWKVLQPGKARSTPGKAVGFLFIPFFGLYWVFVAYLGLAKDWNRVMASHPNLAQAPRMNEGIVVTFCILSFCILWILTGFGFLLDDPELLGGPIGTMLGLLVLSYFIIELIVLAMICKCVNFMGRLHFMPTQGMPGQPGTGPAPGAGGGIRLY